LRYVRTEMQLLLTSLKVFAKLQRICWRQLKVGLPVPHIYRLLYVR
jgi:hypothetical protein